MLKLTGKTDPLETLHILPNDVDITYAEKNTITHQIILQAKKKPVESHSGSKAEDHCCGGHHCKYNWKVAIT